MQRLRAWLQRRFFRLADSIAFLPALLALAFLAFAIAMRSSKDTAFTAYVVEALPSLMVRQREVALSLLMTITGGLISLMVFSFSMVMVLLSNATSNLTPRLLPSLVESRRHQLVLGVYLGTIIYNVVTTMGFGLRAGEDDPPSVAVAFGVLFGIACLAMFIYFIHGVSSSIQVGVVVQEVHESTVRAIERLLDDQDTDGADEPPELAVATQLHAPQAGFFEGVDRRALVRLCERYDTTVIVTAVRGVHLLEGEDILLYEDRRPLDEDTLGALRSAMLFSHVDEIDRYYAFGISHIVEVAQKAMSPGINDPGTAIAALGYLTHLFTLALRLQPYEVYKDAGGVARVYVFSEPWADLLRLHFEKLHTYSADDPEVMRNLMRMLEKLRERTEVAANLAAIDECLGKVEAA